ncbi:MAG: molybdopterin-dependent oxidoreductase [Deltaproteobacteria bacterium]|nr:molybdopterin-dependent oxidoreductase [Deltaproteobacteria bacterium]
MAIEKIETFCRVCESSCGLIAERENDVILSLRPDKSHPVTKGYACPKGIYALEIHHDEDRLNHPLKRRSGRSKAAAEFERTGWDESVRDISDRLQDILRRYGSTALAAFIGNPVAFNSLLSPAIASFCSQTGCRRIFSSGTQDCTNKFAAAEAVYGTSTLHPVPDIDSTQYLLILGENPKVSHMSFLSIANPMEKLKALRRRGGKIRCVDPRRIESADGIGEVIQIMPDTDPYFLAALLQEIRRIGGFRQEAIRSHGKNIEGFEAFIDRYPPERVEKVVGIPAGTIREVARDFSEAQSAAVHMSTGLNMGRQGTLSYWLVQMLSFVTGNLDREGGNLYALGFYPAAKSGRTSPGDPFFDSPFGPLRTVTGILPGNLLSDMILHEKDPIRALVVISGNPVLSMGGEERLREAFEKLELLVVLDIYRNATGEMADFLLPCADMLERGDLNLCGLGMQHQPFVQYTEAVVPPRFERKEQWWILARIEQAMGFDSVLSREQYNPYERIDRMLSYSGLSVAALKTLPNRTALLPEPAPGRFYSDWLQTDDRKVDCCPALFGEALEEAERIFQKLEKEPADLLKLITLRTPFMHNSWYQNIEKLKMAGHRSNPIHINARDAGRRGLEEGAPVRLFNKWGSIETAVRIDDRLRDGVVAMTHGWGNRETPGMKVARQYPGVNVNRLLPTGAGSYEKLSNQAHMTGIPIGIERIAAAHPASDETG